MGAAVTDGVPFSAAAGCGGGFCLGAGSAGVVAGARIAPPAGVDGRRAHEGAEMDLTGFGHGARFPVDGTKTTDNLARPPDNSNARALPPCLAPDRLAQGPGTRAEIGLGREARHGLVPGAEVKIRVDDHPGLL